MLVALKHTRV